MKSFGLYLGNVFGQAYSSFVSYFFTDTVEALIGFEQNTRNNEHQRYSSIPLEGISQLTNDLIHPDDPWIIKWLSILPKDPLTQNIMYDPIVILPSGDSVDIAHANPEFTLELYGVNDLYHYMPNEPLRLVMNMIYLRIGEIDISSSKGKTDELSYVYQLLQLLNGNESIHLPDFLVRLYQKEKIVNHECVININNHHETILNTTLQ